MVFCPRDPYGSESYTTGGMSRVMPLLVGYSLQHQDVVSIWAESTGHRYIENGPQQLASQAPGSIMAWQCQNRPRTTLTQSSKRTRARQAVSDRFSTGKAMSNVTSTDQQPRRNALGVPCSEVLYKMMNKLNTPAFDLPWEAISGRKLTQG